MVDMEASVLNEYPLIDVVSHVRKFLTKPNVKGAPRFFGIYSNPLQAQTEGWVINTDKDLLKIGEKWLGKSDCIEFFIVGRKNASKINQVVEQRDEEDVELSEPTMSLKLWIALRKLKLLKSNYKEIIKAENVR